MICKIFALSFLIWLFLLRWQKRKKIACCNQFKNEIRSMPLFGHTYLVFGNAEVKMKGIQTLGREALRQGGVTSLQSWLMDKFYIIVADPMVAEFVLRHCMEKDDSMKMFKSILGEGMLIAKAPEWRARRKVLNPTFSLKNLNQFVKIFRKNSDVMVEKLHNESEMGPFSIYDYISSYALDSICETILGNELGSQKDRRHPVMEALNMSCQLVSHRMCLPWLHNQTLYELTPQYAMLKNCANTLFSFIEKFISPKLEQYNNKNILRLDNDDQGHKTILQLMIENSNSDVPPTMQYLKEETLVVTFAGTDTSSVAFSFIMLMLARHPGVQDKLYNEISEIYSDPNKLIEPEDLPRLRYMEAVIKETLRLYPPAPLILRKVDKDAVLLFPQDPIIRP